MIFPIVTGINLLRQPLKLPADFGGNLNLLLIAFQQWQQSQINTWLQLAERLEQTYSGLCYYELPVIQRMNVLARTFINEGMRAGIPDPGTRAKTITLYLDRAEFRKALDLPDEDQVYALLVDRQGRVLWRASGAYTPDKAAALPEILGRHVEKMRD